VKTKTTTLGPTLLSSFRINIVVALNDLTDLQRMAHSTFAYRQFDECCCSSFMLSHLLYLAEGILDEEMAKRNQIGSNIYYI
jgi:hypothetical protein